MTESNDMPGRREGWLKRIENIKEAVWELHSEERPPKTAFNELKSRFTRGADGSHVTWLDFVMYERTQGLTTSTALSPKDLEVVARQLGAVLEQQLKQDDGLVKIALAESPAEQLARVTTGLTQALGEPHETRLVE